MKLSNNDLVQLHAVLSRYSTAKNLKVAWMAAQNIHRIDAHLKLMQDLLKNTPAIEEFENARKELAKLRSIKGENGQPIINRNFENPRLSFFAIADMPAFEEEVAALRLAHPEAQTDREELIAREAELLKEEIDFEPYTLSVENTKISSDSNDSILDAATMLMLIKCGILKE